MIKRQETIHHAGSVHLWQHLNPWVMARGLWRQRELIGQMTRRGLHERYRGSVLGLLWAILTPLFTLLVYTFVFSVVLKSRFPDSPVDDGLASKADYALKLFCGLIVFQVFAEALTSSPGVILSHPNFVKKVVFPLEILPVSAVLTSLIQAGISLAILLAGIALFEQSFPLTALIYPVILVPLVMLALGLSWFLSSLGVFVRDITHGMIILSNLMFFLTPVFYDIGRLPEGLRGLMNLNPMAAIVLNARGTLMSGRMPDWTAMGIVTVMAFLLMQLGYAWFMKSKKWFADVI